MKPFLLTLLIASTVSAALFLLGASAQSIEDLRAQQTHLEDDLTSVRAKIEALGKQQASPPKPYYIAAFGLYDVDSAGGVEPSIHLVNPNKSSPIKYANIKMQLFDRVGKPASSSICEGSTAWVKMTGPIAFSDDVRKGRWDPVWYNHSGWCIKLIELDIEFMDGKHRRFTSKTLPSVLKEGLKNGCPPNGPEFQE